MFRKRAPAQTEEQALFDASNPILFLPFCGVVRPFRIRELQSTQIMSMGDISLIETFSDKVQKKKTPSIDELIAYSERQHGICRLAMVAPTYDQVIHAVAPETDFKAIEKELQDIKKLFHLITDPIEKKDLQKIYNRIELQYKFILPADFISSVMDFALNITKSRIKDVSDKMLTHSAILAIRGHDNPSDHIDTSFFTEFQVQDFNNRAWLEYDKSKKTKSG
jgi:hypothetical protein